MATKTETGANETDSDAIAATRVLEAFVLCLIIVIAIVGNISIWIIILKNRPLRTITNMFILGLSAADLLVSIVNMPLTVVSVITRDWPLSELACVVFGFINMLTLVTSVMSLCNISINRYFMVCRPSKFQDIYTKRNAIFMIIGVASVSVILSSPPLYGWGRYSYIPEQSFCFCDWAYHLSYAIFMIACCFGGPCSVMTVCNIFVYRAVRASRRKVVKKIPKSSSVATLQSSSIDEQEQTSETSEIKSCSNSYSIIYTPAMKLAKVNKMKRREEHRLALSLIVVVIVFVICWLPFCVSMLIMIFAKTQVPREFHMFTLLLGYANSGCNPIIYGIMNKRFAAGFKELYCCTKRKFKMPVISSP